jgi:hypothetical protein
VECAAAAGRAHDHPAGVGARGAEKAEEIGAEGGWGRVCCGRGGEGWSYAGFLGEEPVEDVEWGFVGLVVHVRQVGGCRPVYCFSAEFDRGIFGEKVFGRPSTVHGPLLDGLGEDKRLVGPVCGIGFRGEVREAGNGVGWRDVGYKGGEGRVGTLEGSVEDIGEEVGARNGGSVLYGDVEVGGAPGPAPGEIFGLGTGKVLARCFGMWMFNDSAKKH